MKPECEAAVRAAAGDRQLSDADIKAIEDRIHSSAKELRRADPEEWVTKTPGERAQAAAELARSKQTQQMAQAHADTLRRIQMQVQRNQLYDSIPAGKQVKALLADTFLQHGKSNSTPVEAAIRALRRWMKTRLSERDERFIDDPTKQDALAAEMFGHDSGDADAKRAAENLRLTNDAFLDKMDRAGIHIARRKFWAPQPWDYLRINDRATFVQDMLGWLDLGEFMEPDGSQMSMERIRHTLEAAAETLQTNGASKRADKLDAFGHGTGSNLARRYNLARQLHFKDGAAWRAAMRKYGVSDSLGTVWREHFSRAARDLAIAQTYGPHADIDIRRQLERAKANDLAAATGPKEKRAIERDARQFLQMWDVTLRGHAPGNSQMAAWMGAVRAAMSASRLGVLANQIVSDPLMLMNYGKLVGMNTAHVTGDILRGIAGGNREALRMVGAWSDAMHEVSARFGDTEVFNRVSRFLNGNVYKWSGMRAADRGMASAITGMYYGTLGDRLASGESFASLPKAWREFMQKHGIDADDWELLRSVKLTRAFDDDRQMLNPADIHNVPDAALRAIAERRAAGSSAELQDPQKREALGDAYNRQVAAEIERLKDETLTKLLGGFEDFMHAAGRGFAEGTVSENHRLGLNQTDPSSPIGVALRFAWMIRQIPINMAFTHLFDVPRGLEGWSARNGYVARYMLGQAVATGIALQLKHLIAGEDPEDMTSWKFLGKMVGGAGLGPLLATLLFGSGGEHHDMLGEIAGPGGEALSDLYGIVSTARDDAAKEGQVDWGKVGNRAMSFARSNAAPFMNFWYTKAAFNHFIYQQLQEKVDPGYNERVAQRLRQRDVSQWWENGQMVPQRAPDFGAAVAGAPGP